MYNENLSQYFIKKSLVPKTNIKSRLRIMRFILDKLSK